ncbi:MAG TPA: DNA-processing protein DprA [Gemmatimonadales bacterium]|nr:DNA-processing protein DprA [Gemmatimonadales bacterium]
MHALLGACGSARAARRAPRAELVRIAGVSPALATAIAGQRPELGEAALAAAARLGGRAILPSDAEYPFPLRNIPEPPLMLFALGRIELLARAAVAIVGSRDHSRYGAEVCRAVARVVARAGAVVVSGMARGLDAVAHQAALDAGGATIGVLGNGLGVVYPAANEALYASVATAGLLLTEFPPGERPHAGSFPRRNRIISGLARAVVVVEAAVGSGALITAGSALDQGREVVAVPGPITSRTSEGCNRLIRDGATPLLEATDVMQYLPELVLPPETEPGRPSLPDGLTEGERALAGSLGAAPAYVDDLAARLRRPVAELLVQLSTLELAGVVARESGGLFRRV